MEKLKKHFGLSHTKVKDKEEYSLLTTLLTNTHTNMQRERDKQKRVNAKQRATRSVEFREILGGEPKKKKKKT